MSGRLEDTDAGSDDAAVGSAVRGLGPNAGFDPVLFEAVAQQLFGPDEANRPRYQPEQELGRGAFGTVYRALDTELDRPVALKVLRSHKELSAARMRVEAQAIAQVSHPNVVQIYDVVWKEDHVQIAMELCDGDLSTWLAEKPRSWPEVVDMMIRVGRGLVAIHAAGLVHRDFKPSNVLLSAEGEPKIADFGLARLIEGNERQSTVPNVALLSTLDERLTATGSVVGTPAYMAPEQHRGLPVGVAADQFAFCVTLYEALLGERPFRGSSNADILAAKRTGEPEKLIRLPRPLAKLLRRGLHPDPRQRHPSMAAVVQALIRVRRGRGTTLALGAGVAAIVVGGLAVAAVERHDPCGEQRARFDATWSAQRSATLSSRFSSDPLGAESWEATAAALDDWSRRWHEELGQACAQRSPLRLACLERRRVGLEAYIDVASEDPVFVHQTTNYGEVLRDPHDCATPDPGLEGEFVEAELANALHAELAKARAERLAARDRDARARAVEVLARAEELSLPRLQVEASILVGSVDASMSRYDRALPLLEDAAWTAQAEGFDELALDAMLQIIGHAVKSGFPDTAEDWVGHARAVCARLGSPTAQAELDAVLAVRAYHARDMETARRLLEGLLGESVDLLPPHVQVESMLNYAGVLLDGGEVEAATRWFTHAQLVADETFGPNHILSASVLARRAMMFLARGDVDVAMELMERAQKVASQLPSAHPSVSDFNAKLGMLFFLCGDERGVPMLEQACSQLGVGAFNERWRECNNNLVAVYTQTGRRDEARTVAELALQELDRLQVPPDRFRTSLMMSVADLDRERGELELARAGFLRVLELIDEHQITPQRKGWCSSRLGDISLEMELPEDAAGYYERAIEQLGPDAHFEFRANVRFGLAKATTLAGGDAQRARRLAGEALQLLEGQPTTFAREKVPEITTWLDAHRTK